MKNLLLTIALFTSLCSTIYAEDGWHLTTFLGSSESLNSGLNINLSGEDNIHKNADWHGQSWKDTLYFSIRLEKWKGNKGQGFDYTHHKIYLKNTDDDIKDFSISDGYNILSYNWATRQENQWIRRFGGGVVFAHMDTTLRDRDRFYMDGGIGGAYLSGLAVQGSMEKWIKEWDNHFISFETKLTLSYVRPPVSESRNEYAETWNIAGHIVLGVGSKPIKTKTPTRKDRLKWFGIPAAYYSTVFWFEPVFYGS